MFCSCSSMDMHNNYAFLMSHSDSFVFFAFVVSSFTVSLRDIPLRVGTWARVEGIVTHQERAHMHRCTHESPKKIKKISQVAAANSFGDNNVPFIHQEHSLGWRSVLIEGSRSNFEAVRTILYHPKRHLKANERTNKQHPFHCFKSLIIRLPTFESIYGDARCFKGKVESAGGQRYQNTCCYM